MAFERLKETMDFYSTGMIPGCSVMVRKDHDVIFTYETGFSYVENAGGSKVNSNEVCGGVYSGKACSNEVCGGAYSGKACSNEVCGGEVCGGVPYTGDELVYLYSCTKMFTCTAALQLIEQGKLSLDDSLNKYYPAADPRIRMLNLFNMTAGYDYDLSCVDHLRGSLAGTAFGSGAGTQEIISEIIKKPLHFAPGEQWLYGLEHDILGGVIELVSGERFADYLEDHIIDPLGLNNTTMKVTDAVAAKLAPQYLYDRISGTYSLHTKENTYIVNRNYDCGGAGLVSTRRDLSVFLDALACGGIGANGARILREESIKLYSANTLHSFALNTFNYQEPNMLGHGYGLGVRTFIDPHYGDDLVPVGEFGWGGAAGTEEIVDPINHLSLSFITHVLECYGSQIMAQLLHAMYCDIKYLK